jgi:hypothetical protein
MYHNKEFTLTSETNLKKIDCVFNRVSASTEGVRYISL